MTTNIASVARRAALAAVSGIAATAVLASTAFAATTPWTVMPSANNATGDTRFSAVSMVDDTHGFAVGDADGKATIESWNGTSWNLMAAPSPDSSGILRGVSAVSATDAWAVGTTFASSGPQETLIEHFDGAAWTIVPSPNIGVNSQLNAVSARAANDVWAVGQDGVNESKPIIEHWDGAAWTVVQGVAAPSNGIEFLKGVTVAPDGTVWAVGTVGQALNPEGFRLTAFVERFTGGGWRSVPVPATNPSFSANLNAVSAASANDVWAVGSVGSQALAEHWNGTAWSIVATPAVSGKSIVLKGVKAVGPNDAWFVGDQSLATISEQSNGTTTAIVPTPSGSQRGDLSGIAAVGRTLYAVGSQTNDASTFQQQTLALINAAG
ncbi:hypothetical protein [Kutzneria buriramensis]|uniref:Uncharacterized protein n=1 Tax=Kutzneria buriramensis TaxID=1045776 RepID=A0A3E0GVI3_9PSEU|nr:hypothetical protein [Kutzneria buriramensis]REH27666.1 hypothetical protein BCF44_12954 [Kutzneria buriramensis]